MADNTKIEWADATLNYVNGCSVVSPGCTNCYAMKLAGTRLKHHPSRAGLTQDTKAGPVWTGEVRVHEPALMQALSWKRGRRIFWNAHGDLFHENVSDETIDRLFAVCALTPQHTHMILTKRSARMREYMSDQGAPERIAHLVLIKHHGGSPPTIYGGAITDRPDRVKWPLPNVWLGVSVEDQQRADERIPDLLATPAAVRFISAEPLLGPLELERWLEMGGLDTDLGLSNPGIDWVIIGGESGPGARPMHQDWARSLRDQCQAAGVAFHFKQWGEWAPDPGGITFDTAKGRAQRTPAFILKHDGTVHCFLPADEQEAPVILRIGKKRAGRLLDGREWNEVPR